MIPCVRYPSRGQDGEGTEEDNVKAEGTDLALIAGEIAKVGVTMATVAAYIDSAEAVSNQQSHIQTSRTFGFS